MILVVDVKGLAYRTAWSASKGVSPVNGLDLTPLHGFFMSLNAVLQRVPHIRQIIFCADPPNATYPMRRAIWPEYKVRAPGKPGGQAYTDAAEGRQQAVALNLPLIKTACRLVESVWFEDPDWEADDLIAWTTHNWRPDVTRVILSNDRDLFQLIRPNVEQMVAQKKQYVVLTHENFSTTALQFMLKGKTFEKYAGKLSCPQPWHLAWKCLVGDTSDGIPGLHRVGEVTALQMVKDHAHKCLNPHPVPLVLNYIDHQNRQEGGPAALAQRLDRERAETEELLNRNWALMHLPADRQVPARSGQVGHHDPKALRDFFQAHGLRSLVESSSLYQNMEKLR